MLNNKLLPIVSLSFLGLITPIYAADEFQDRRWYVAPFGTFVLTDDDRLATNGFGGGMGFGKILDQHFNIELKGFYQGYSTSSGAWSMSGGSVDVQFYFSRDKFTPYTVFGLGGMNSCLGKNSGVNCTAGFIGEMGMGLSYELDDNLLIRSDIRYRYNNNHGVSLQSGASEFSDMVVNLGIVIPFGEKPISVAVKSEAPLAAPQPAKTDCTTRDSDSDGVNDCLDKCPNTPKASKVDLQGCLLKLVLKGQHFKFDSARLMPEAKLILDEVAANLIAFQEKTPIEHGKFALMSESSNNASCGI